MTCNCEAKYTIEPHDEEYALFYGRCDHHHGYNLAYITGTAWNFDRSHIEKLLNLGNIEYQKNPDGEYLAE